MMTTFSNKPKQTKWKLKVNLVTRDESILVPILDIG